MFDLGRFRPLHVTALGTSSFVVPGGFAQPFLESDVVFTNLSMEASGACLIGAHLGDQPWRGAHCLLLGFANMEEVLVHQGSSALPDVVNALRCAIDAACRAGCVPILVQWPHRRFLDRAIVSDGMRMVFERAGLPVLDVGSLIRAASAKGGTPPADFFRDDTHLKIPVAYAVGRSLLRSLQVAPGGHESPLSPAAERFLPLWMLPIGSGIPTDVPLRTRTYYGYSCPSLLLREGMEIEVPAQDGPCSIIGIVLNSFASRGQLMGEDGSRLNYSLPRMPFSEADEHVFLNARPIPPVTLPPRGLRLRPTPRAQGTDGGPPQTELCGLILRSDAEARTMMTRTVPAEWRDLTRRIASDLVPDLARVAGGRDPTS